MKKLSKKDEVLRLHKLYNQAISCENLEEFLEFQMKYDFDKEDYYWWISDFDNWLECKK
jgi:DNA-binding transcriptional regulator YbjK